VNPKDPADVRHVHDDELQMYILGRLRLADVDSFERHVLNCGECTERLAGAARFVAQIIGLKKDYSHPDRRVGPRFSASGTGSLRCFSPLLSERWPIQIVDVSRDGLGLFAPTSLSVSALVQVHVGDVFALGEVRYSRRVSDQQYRVGVRLLDLFKTKSDADK